MSLLYDHKTNTNDCHVLLDDNSVDDVSHSILLRIPLLIFTSCLGNSIIKFILKSIIEIICSIPNIRTKQKEGGSFNCKWRPSLQSITEEEEEEEVEEDEDLIFSQEQEKEEVEVSTQIIMKASSQKEKDMRTAAVFSFSSASSSSSNNKTAGPILTILSNRFTILLLQSRSILRYGNQVHLGIPLTVLLFEIRNQLLTSN